VTPASSLDYYCHCGRVYGSCCGHTGPVNVIQQEKGFVEFTADFRFDQGYDVVNALFSIKLKKKKKTKNPPCCCHSEILITTKPRLEDPKPSILPTLIRDLHRVASLAESFTEHRPRSNKSWVHLVDTLDQEGMFDSSLCCLSGQVHLRMEKNTTGVNLWNISGLARKTPEDDGRSLVAACRGFFSFLISPESYHNSRMREMK
jgi:hypothetical protein